MVTDLSSSKVSIGMSTFNSSSTIERAIESVILQSHQNWELIIIDANSTDGTAEIIKMFSVLDHRIIYVIKNEQQGWMKSSFQELEIATGDFFMWLDPDDFISYKYVKTLLESLRDKDHIGAIGLLQLIDYKGDLIENNLSSLRLFKFTSNRFTLIRVLIAILHPESFGLVNMIYSLWRTESLRFIRSSTPENLDFRYDQIFLLNALKKGKIIHLNQVFHFRTARSKNRKKYSSICGSNDGKNFPKFPRKINFYEFVWSCMKNMPPVKYYFSWIVKENIVYRFIYLLGLLFRIIISAPLYILKLTKFNRIKFY
jgi:glycosyltransferase involved in cell wall biosynthesis